MITRATKAIAIFLLASLTVVVGHDQLEAGDDSKKVKWEDVKVGLIHQVDVSSDGRKNAVVATQFSLDDFDVEIKTGPAAFFEERTAAESTKWLWQLVTRPDEAVKRRVFYGLPIESLSIADLNIVATYVGSERAKEKPFDLRLAIMTQTSGDSNGERYAGVPVKWNGDLLASFALSLGVEDLEEFWDQNGLSRSSLPHWGVEYASRRQNSSGVELAVDTTELSNSIVLGATGASFACTGCYRIGTTQVTFTEFGRASILVSNATEARLLAFDRKIPGIDPSRFKPVISKAIVFPNEQTVDWPNEGVLGADR